MKILYVEDNPTNVYLLRRVAKMGKHKVINYIDGDEALKKYDDIDPDLVLMDIQLAGEKTGLDVVRILRERGVTVPIIAVTAYAMVGDRERCIEAGCDDYLAKPLAIPRLVELFQTYSDKTRVSETSPVGTPAEPLTTVAVDTSHLTTQPIPSPEEIAEADAATDTPDPSSIQAPPTDSVPEEHSTDDHATDDDEADDAIIGSLDGIDETLPLNADDIFDKTHKIDNIVLTDEEQARSQQDDDEDKVITTQPASSTTTESKTPSPTNDEDVDTQPDKNIDATHIQP